MQKVFQTYRQFKPVHILTRLSTLQEAVIKVLRSNKCTGKQAEPRGPLPWEKATPQCGKSTKEFRKKEEPVCKGPVVQEKSCGCPTLQRPKRNTYEWVIIEDDTNCKPFGMKALIDKTVCELRRFKKCMYIFRDESKCQNLAPVCKTITKVYPILDTVQRKSLSGCAKPLPVKPKEEEKIEEKTEKQEGKKNEEKPEEKSQPVKKQ